MLYGPIPSKNLPEQKPEDVLKHAERWARAAWAHQRWAEKAKECVDFTEGRQWTEQQLAEMAKQKRPALTFNKIAALVRLVLGYHRNNRTDAVYEPGYDGQGTEDIADVLTTIDKQISEMNSVEFVDTEVMMDGIICARGWWDQRISFEDNDFGEVRIRADDPFTVYVDPDAQRYDLKDAGFIMETRMVDIDEVRLHYGDAAADAVVPYVHGQTPFGPIASHWQDGETTPVRYFGNREEGIETEWWDRFYGYMGDFVDPLRKSIRLIDIQHRIVQPRIVLIDLETGDRKVVPPHFRPEQIQKMLLHAEMVGNPLVAERRPVKLVRWTTLAGDVMLYDRWSPYDDFTKTLYAPWFRRGTTRGMVEDLIDPQREVNKRRSAQIDIVSRTAHSGWEYHEDSLDPIEERNLKSHGAEPGFVLKWKGENKPTKIEPSTPPTAFERLETRAENDLHTIGGINEAALGLEEKVQSGRALEAKQRQAVIGVQVYMDNFRRSKEILAGKRLSLVQNHYTEERIFRIMGEDGRLTQTVINRQIQDPASGVASMLNDITLGKYIVKMDETPLSASFQDAQFEEALTILDKLAPNMPPQLAIAFADILIDMSSLPRKDEIKARVQAVMAAMGLGGTPAGGAPGGGGGLVTDGAAPAMDQSAQPGGNVVQLQPDGGVAAA